jgi:hypothetical protein
MSHHHDTSRGASGEPVTSPPLALAAAFAEMLRALRCAAGLPSAAEVAETAGARNAGRRGRARSDAPEAASLPDGTPHSDPRLAARGWQAQHGLYVRCPAATTELEAS